MDLSLLPFGLQSARADDLLRMLLQDENAQDIVVLPGRRRVARRRAAAAGRAVGGLGTLASPVPDGDAAVIELDARHALECTQQTGPYSRFEFRHPGPAMYYLLAPLVAACGPAGLPLGAALLNLAAVLTSLVVVRRLAGRSGVWCGLLLTAYFHVLDPGVGFSCWTPFFIVLPCVAAILLLAAVAVGRLACLPPALLAVSFIVQSHISVALALGGVTLLCVSVFASRTLCQVAGHPRACAPRT